MFDPVFRALYSIMIDVQEQLLLQNRDCTQNPLKKREEGEQTAQARANAC
jgi:hypothetical protein